MISVKGVLLVHLGIHMHDCIVGVSFLKSEAMKYITFIAGYVGNGQASSQSSIQYRKKSYGEE